MNKDKLNPIYLNAFIDFISIWGKTEISSDCEIDFPKLFAYVNSDAFFFKHLNIQFTTDEEVYNLCMKEIEKETLDGFSIWDFLKIPQRLKDLFNKQLYEEQELERKKYLCYNCKYLELDNTSLGEIPNCLNEEAMKFKKDQHRFERWSFYPEKIRKCKFFEKGEYKKCQNQ